MIVTPFRNEDHSIPHYLKGLREIDYPKELIDIYWLENDSSDKTLSMLQEAKDDLPFKSMTLESINILGPVKKRESGGYVKDIGSGKRRRNAWLVIWNSYFIPLAKKVNHKYILFWYADAVPPPNVITEYLKVFDKYSAGWVGGRMLRRIPHLGSHRNEFPFSLLKLLNIHVRKMGDWSSPRPITLATQNIRHPIECKLTGHVFMIPREPLCKCTFHHAVEENHYSITQGLAMQGLKVYYQPSVYIKHVSTDGKIWEPQQC